MNATLKVGDIVKVTGCTSINLNIYYKNCTGIITKVKVSSNIRYYSVEFSDKKTFLFFRHELELVHRFTKSVKESLSILKI